MYSTYTVAESTFFLACALYSSSSHTTWNEKHFSRSWAYANSKVSVQHTPGKAWEFQFKKHKRKIEVQIGRKRVRKAGK